MKETIYMIKKRYKKLTLITMCINAYPDLAQLVEHLTVVVTNIKGSPVRIR